MMPLLKKNGKVRICVDLEKLTEQVEREIHPTYTRGDYSGAVWSNGVLQPGCSLGVLTDSSAQ